MRFFVIFIFLSHLSICQTNELPGHLSSQAENIPDTNSLRLNYIKANAVANKDPNAALILFRENLALSKRLRSDKNILKNYYGIAKCFQEMDLLDSVPVYIFKGLDLSERTNDAEGINDAKKRLGNLYMRVSDYKKAIKSFLAVLDYYTEKNDSISMLPMFNNLGACYSYIGENEKGLHYCRLAEKKLLNSKTSSDRILLAHAYINTANLYYSKNDSLLTIKYLEKAYNVVKEEKKDYMILLVCANLGKAYYRNAENELAKKYLEEGLLYCKAGSYLDLKAQIYEILALVCEKEKNYRQAFEYLFKNNSLKDSVKLISKINLTNKLELEHKMEKHELEMSIKDANISTKNKLILNVILFALLILCILYIILQKTKKTLVAEIKIKKEIVQQKNKAEEQIKQKASELASMESTLQDKISEVGKANLLLYKKNEEIDIANYSLGLKNKEVKEVSELLSHKNEEVAKISESLKNEIAHREEIVNEKQKTDLLLQQKMLELNAAESELLNSNKKIESAKELLAIKNKEIDETVESLKEKNETLDKVTTLLNEKVIEIDHIEKSLDKKNEELVTYAILLAQKNEIILNSIEKINQLNSESPSHVSFNLKGIVSDLKYSNNETTWREFEQKFVEQHGDFYEKLATNFPELTPNEIRMCALLKLNMSTKEIASITLQTIRAVEVARHRIRKKMSLAKEDNLINYLRLKT